MIQVICRCWQKCIDLAHQDSKTACFAVRCFLPKRVCLQVPPRGPLPERQLFQPFCPRHRMAHTRDGWHHLCLAQLHTLNEVCCMPLGSNLVTRRCTVPMRATVFNTGQSS